MKRDLDLARRILLRLEAGADSVADEGRPSEEIQYHIRLLAEAGLIEADEIVPGQWWPERITWMGHELLDASRDEALWLEVRGKVEAASGSAPLSVLQELLVNGIRKRLAKPVTAAREKKTSSSTLRRRRA
jgi:hypothetical protein